MAVPGNPILDSSNAFLAVTNKEGAPSSPGIETLDGLPLGTAGGTATGELGVKVITVGSGSGASSTTVQGTAADNAVAVGNPVYVGGLAVAGSTYAPAYTAGDAAALAVDKDSGGILTTVVLRSGATGTTKFRSLTVTNTATAVKASAGNLYAWNIINLHSATIFVKFYDAASGSVTVGTTAPVFVQEIAANGSLAIRGADLPVNFATAITVACVTGGADNNTTAAATLPILEFEYV